MSLGQTSLDLALYFNPRFESEGDAGIIVCNSMKGGVWEEEQRESCFPFQKGQDAKVSGRGSWLGAGSLSRGGENCSTHALA